jgi:hypothetical protein
MTEISIDSIDALVGPATPHFAPQIRARVREAIAPLAADDPVHRYGEERIAMLEDLGYASSKAEHDEEPEPRSRPGWAQIPSSARVAEPLPRRRA